MLHVLEICLAVPLFNAESERVFSFLWCIFSKEQQSMKHCTLEILLRIRSDVNLCEERYKDAVDMTMNTWMVL